MAEQDEATVVETMRRDQADLYAMFDQLRQRVARVEAMTVALAWTHPDGMRLLAELHHWLELPEVTEMPEDIRALKEKESERTYSMWTAVMAAQLKPNGAPVVLH